MNDTHLITRIDCDRKATHGWNVRIQRNGNVDSQFFADRKHGGTYQALKLAQQWRDANRVPLSERNRKPASPRTCLATIKGRAFWRAIIPGGGRLQTKSFSVDRYGHDEAKRLAAEFLESQTVLPS